MAQPKLIKQTVRITSKDNAHNVIHREVTGYVLKGLAVTPPFEPLYPNGSPRKEWYVTHIVSGLHMGEFKNRKQATNFLTAVVDLIDWTQDQESVCKATTNDVWTALWEARKQARNA